MKSTAQILIPFSQIYIYVYIPIKNMEGGLNGKQAASVFICLEIGIVIGGASH